MGKIISSLIEAISGTLKGHDGKISSRKTAAFWFSVVATIQSVSLIVRQWLVATKAIPLTAFTVDSMRVEYDFYVATLAMILLLFGIITLGQVQSLRTVVNAEVKKEEAKNENSDV